MRKILFLFTLIILAACKAENSNNDENRIKERRQKMESDKNEVVSHPYDSDVSPNHVDPTVSTQKSASSFSYKVIYEEQTGWGYQIFDGSKMVINQIHIPAVQGIQGFSSQKKAEKTANYVVKQIEKGNFPPTLSKEILDSLKVL